ncbi:MAG: M14 family metallocarboxypeptidase [Gammaproteobacteria bacterium]|nr:M14 family metallocarboxypeptidase [Gammaproteobacteria bacterium]
MLKVLRFCIILLYPCLGIAQKTESSCVAAQYPDPAIEIHSPAFMRKKIQFTSQGAMLHFIQQLRSPYLRTRSAGVSQEGREIPLLIFSKPTQSQKPTVLIVAQQHGNEPAGGEAALAVAWQLTQTLYSSLLDKVNIIIVPRANPDGAAHFVRNLANGYNLNRDHLELVTPEARAIAKVFVEYQPDVVLDCHEFTVAVRWLEKFSLLQKYDGLLQSATTMNLPAALNDISLRFYYPAINRAFDQKHLTHSLYYTTSHDVQNKIVSMGGIVPDTSRNIAGLRNAISFLLETRGVGLGTAHFKRRVMTHMTAIHAVFDTTVQHANEIISLHDRLNNQISESAGRGQIIILGRALKEKHELSMLDKQGHTKLLLVDWRSAFHIQKTLTRQRPFSYLLAPTEKLAAERLTMLGIKVYQITNPLHLSVQQYQIVSVMKKTKHDVTGSAGAANEVIQVKTQLKSLTMNVQHYFYVPLNQPLANLAIAALEPESESSYVSNHLIKIRRDSFKLPLFSLTIVTSSLL